MSDSHALSGAYAVDALDDAERAEFERHLADCPACRAEVDSLREAAATLAETTTTTPSPALRARVLAEIATVRPLPPLTSPPATAPAADEPAEPAAPPLAPAATSGPGAPVTALEPRRRRRVTALLAAAAAVVAIGTGGVVWQQLGDDAPQSRVDQVLAASDAESYTQELPGGTTATVVRSKRLNEAVLITENMPAAPTGHSYALWLQHDDVMVPAGIMPEGEDNEVLLSGDAATADGAGITVETAGVEHPEPEGETVVVFAFDA